MCSSVQEENQQVQSREHAEVESKKELHTLEDTQSAQENAGLPPSRRAKAPQHKVIRYAQGAGEGSYHEVIHASPTKIAAMQQLLGSEQQCNLDVSGCSLSLGLTD